MVITSKCNGTINYAYPGMGQGLEARYQLVVGDRGMTLVVEYETSVFCDRGMVLIEE